MSPWYLARVERAWGWALPYAVIALIASSCAPVWRAPRPTGQAPHPIEQTYTTDSIFVETEGDGPAALFVHAFSMDRRMWADDATALSGQVRAIRFDQRGYGRTPNARGPYRTVDDLRNVLDAVHATRAIVVGLSSGAQIAVDFALAYPDRVSALILASPGLSGYVPRTQPAWMGPVMDAARSGDPMRTAHAWIATPLMRVDRAAGAEAIREMAIDNAKIWSFANNMEKPIDRPALARLNELHVPVLVLVGAQDVSEAANVADILVKQVSGAKRTTIPGAGHMLNLAAPEAFDAAIVHFMRSHRIVEN